MYKIALIQVDFDNSYKNVLRFDSREQQRAYFNVDTLFSQQLKEVNFPFGTFYMTRVPIKLSNTQQNDMLSYNYAIVKDMTKTNVYFYYFVKNANYDAGNTQMLCDLELDIFNTYYIDTSFTPCLINRAHLDRWGDISSGTVSFNASIYSKLYAQENVQPSAKYLASREEINLIDTLSDASVKAIIKQKVKGWVYMFLDPNVIGNIKSGNSSIWINEERLHKTNIEGMVQNYYVLVFPMCDKDVFEISWASLSTPEYRAWSYKELEDGELGQPEKYLINLFAPYILDMVISQQPPMSLFTDDNFAVSVVSGKIRIQCLSSADPQDSDYYVNHYDDGFACLSYLNPSGWWLNTRLPIVNMQNYKMDYRNILNLTSPYNFTFNVSDITENAHDKNYNPKLLMQPYREVRLGYANAVPQTYDILKLNKTFKMKWLNNLEPAILKGYVGFYNVSNEIYSVNTFKSFLGCKLQLDASLPYSIDQMKSYLAQNKNFYQIARNVYQANVGSSIMRGTASSMSSLGLTKIGGKMASRYMPVLAIASMLGDIMQANVGYENAMLTLDNMDNAPETFKHLDNSIFLNLNINGTKPYIEYWECLDYELTIADADMNINGYTYNQIDNVKNCDNIRHYWNFVQAQIENITSTMIMSNDVREKFKSVFSSGVRFWNITDLVTNHTYNYNTHENYERRLLNE